MERMRRLRVGPVLRGMVRENHVRREELIYPIFVMEGQNICNPVDSMPGICQYSLDRLSEELDRVIEAKLSAILLFGIPLHKDEVGSGAYDENGIVQTAIRFIKSKENYKNLIVIADVCLCEYTSHGHCGLIRNGVILNDETLPLLAKTAVSYAKAGADIIAPSDMMDKRVGAIREVLFRSQLWHIVRNLHLLSMVHFEMLLIRLPVLVIAKHTRWTQQIDGKPCVK